MGHLDCRATSLLLPPLLPTAQRTLMDIEVQDFQWNTHVALDIVVLPSFQNFQNWEYLQNFLPILYKLFNVEWSGSSTKSRLLSASGHRVVWIMRFIKMLYYRCTLTSLP